MLNNVNNKISICFVTTEHFNVQWHLFNLIHGLKSDYNVVVIGNCVSVNSMKFDNVTFIDVPIRREISLYYDIYSLIRLVAIFLSVGPSIIHSTMPKSGLLTALAGFISFRKYVFHTFTGQVWADYTGIKRKLFVSIDKLIVKLNFKCFTDSKSQSDYLFVNGVLLNKNPLPVLGEGSLMGSKLSKHNFNHSKLSRSNFGFVRDDFVLLYLARKSPDKGCFLMIDILVELLKKDDSYRLLFVGPDETSGMLSDYMKKTPELSRFINSIDYADDIIPLLESSDLLCAPSRREGFGTIVIDAAFAQLPTVASDIPGFQDSILNNKTGYLCEVNSISNFVEKISFLKDNPDILFEFGLNAKSRSSLYFSSDYLVDCYKEFYISLK